MLQTPLMAGKIINLGKFQSYKIQMVPLVLQTVALVLTRHDLQLVLPMVMLAQPIIPLALPTITQMSLAVDLCSGFPRSQWQIHQQCPC